MLQDSKLPLHIDVKDEHVVVSTGSENQIRILAAPADVQYVRAMRIMELSVRLRHDGLSVNYKST